MLRFAYRMGQFAVVDQPTVCTEMNRYMGPQRAMRHYFGRTVLERK